MKTAILNWIQDLPNEKQTDVVRSRFGLRGSPKTLAEIGRDMSITRERARQIEASALAALANLAPPPEVRRAREWAKNRIEETHGFRSRESLERLFADRAETAAPDHLHLILVTAPGLKFRKQTEHVNDFYHTIAIDGERVHRAFEDLHGHLRDGVVGVNDFAKVVREKVRRHLPGLEFEDRNLEEILRLTRLLGKNQFDEVGHADHPRIQLKTIRWKIRAILEREDGPLHFSDIHRALRKQFDDASSLQSIHNELIRSSDFVLAGRGLFALKEAGYDNRNVRDILVEFLRGSGPQGVDACVSHVLKRKLVKRETILTTLYNGGYFKRTDERTFDTIR